MLFKSVFDELDSVRDAVESGRVDSEDLIVKIDKNSLGIFLSDESQFFDGYESDEYYMSPGTEVEKQALFYDNFGRPEELCVELLQEFLGGSSYQSVNYRGSDKSTNFTE